MKPFAFLTALLVLASSAYGDDRTDADAVTMLDVHLDKIRKENQTVRLWTSGSFLALGAAVGLGGYAATEAYQQQLGPALPAVQGAALGTAVFFGGLGLIDFFWKTDFETLPERYLKFPKGTLAEVRNRRVYGETVLKTLANESRFNRLMSAGTSAAAGAAFLASYTSKSVEDTTYLYSGVSYLLTGLVLVLIKTTAETALDDYNQGKTEP